LVERSEPRRQQLSLFWWGLLRPPNLTPQFPKKMNGPV
jgi:hypothetical protein